MQFIPTTPDSRRAMLETIGVNSFDELIEEVPSELRRAAFRLPRGLSELELTRVLGSLAARNATTDQYLSFLGGGYYEHFIPSVVDYVVSRGEFATAYTPYQAEASQGTLQTIYEFQSLITELTGMEVANASLYDGASALAEACLVALRHTERSVVVLSSAIHPEYRHVVKTYLEGMPVEVVEVPWQDGETSLEALQAALNDQVACVAIQQPNCFGCLEEMAVFAERAHRAGALFIACVNPISLGILSPPGDYHADIAVGEGQPLGLPLAYGGPSLGLFTCTEALMRKIPGRIAGITQDAEGRRGFVLTLQAREQHIRRERATSNVCTNVALCALAATTYLSLMGKAGIREVAEQNLAKAEYAKRRLARVRGAKLAFQAPTFNEFVVRFPRDPQTLLRQLEQEQILGGLWLGRWFPELRDALLVCVTETKTKDQIDRFVDAVKRHAA